MNQPPKLRIRRPVDHDFLTENKSKTKFTYNEDFVFGLLVGVVGVITVELIILLIYGLVGAIGSLFV